MPCALPESKAQQLEAEREAQEQRRQQRTVEVIAAIAGGGGGRARSPAGTFFDRTGGQPELLLFGGAGHKTFLGCLTCSEYANDSVLNEYGQHGSKYRSESIFNEYGSFGSAYSSFSACSEYASDPPVIVDRSGKYYGRLTINQYRDQTRLENVVPWLAGVCQR